MFLLVTGGSASGKSEYAESRAIKLAGEHGGALLYLAAMMPFGKEAGKRIERHRRLRSGKGFETIERYKDIAGLCCGNGQEERIFRQKAAGSTIMLECMSNLTANEMFQTETGEPRSVADTEEKILKGICALRELSADLIIVSIDVFGDGQRYDAETEQYRQCLGELNRELSVMADEVVEVVYGIPLLHKEMEGK